MSPSCRGGFKCGMHSLHKVILLCGIGRPGPLRPGSSPSNFQHGPTPSSAGARRDERRRLSSAAKCRKLILLSGSSAWCPAHRMLPPAAPNCFLLFFMCKRREKIKNKKKNSQNLQLCGKLGREQQFHGRGRRRCHRRRRRHHQWVFGSERTSSTRTDDDARESASDGEVGAGESVQSREKCVNGENLGFYLLNFIIKCALNLKKKTFHTSVTWIQLIAKLEYETARWARDVPARRENPVWSMKVRPARRRAVKPVCSFFPYFLPPLFQTKMSDAALNPLLNNAGVPPPTCFGSEGI